MGQSLKEVQIYNKLSFAQTFFKKNNIKALTFT